MNKFNTNRINRFEKDHPTRYVSKPPPNPSINHQNRSKSAHYFRNTRFHPGTCSNLVNDSIKHIVQTEEISPMKKKKKQAKNANVKKESRREKTAAYIKPGATRYFILSRLKRTRNQKGEKKTQDRVSFAV